MKEKIIKNHRMMQLHSSYSAMEIAEAIEKIRLNFSLRLEKILEEEDNVKAYRNGMYRLSAPLVWAIAQEIVGNDLGFRLFECGYLDGFVK